MKKVVFLSAALIVSLLISESSGRRDLLTPEQKDKLDKAERVLVEVVAVTDQGTIAPDSLTETVGRRMKELGYTVVTAFG